MSFFFLSRGFRVQKCWRSYRSIGTQAMKMEERWWEASPWREFIRERNPQKKLKMFRENRELLQLSPHKLINTLDWLADAYKKTSAISNSAMAKPTCELTQDVYELLTEHFDSIHSKDYSVVLLSIAALHNATYRSKCISTIEAGKKLFQLCEDALDSSCVFTPDHLSRICWSYSRLQ